MASGIARIVRNTPVEVWSEVPGVIKAVLSNGGFTVTVKGVDVGPVWSVNNQVHAVGVSVTVLLRGSVPQGLLP